MPEGRGTPCRTVWLTVAMLVVGIDSARPQGFIAEPARPLAGNAAPTEEAYVPTIDRPPAWDRPAVSRGADDRPALEGSWNHGMRLSSPDSAFVFFVGGRTQLDASGYSASAGPDAPPGEGGLNPSLYPAVNFRRARLMVYGTYDEIYDFNCEYDFVNQYNINSEAYPTERDTGPLPAPTDLWMQVREVGWLGTVRVGNQKDPYGFEHLCSSRWR